MTDTPVTVYCFTAEQLRERDERIIEATMRYCWTHWYSPERLAPGAAEGIIAQANEVDQ